MAMIKRVLLAVTLVGLIFSSAYATPSYWWTNVWLEHRQYDSHYNTPDTLIRITADATLALESGDVPGSIEVYVSWDTSTVQVPYSAPYLDYYEYWTILAENPSSLSEWETTYQFLIDDTGATSDVTIGEGQLDLNDFAIPTLGDNWTFSWNAVQAAEGATVVYRLIIQEWANGEYPSGAYLYNSGNLNGLSCTINPLPPGEYAVRMEAREYFGGDPSHFANRSTYYTYLLVLDDVCECDLNDDGSCNGLDWLLFYPDWGRTDCTGSPDPCECDLNNDGSCNGLDWLLFYPDWGRTDCPVPSACSGELYYDSGTPSDYGGGGLPDFGLAVKFTPPSYPWTFDLARFYPYSGTLTLDLEVHVWDDNGPGGLPGSDLIPPFVHHCSATEQWEEVNLPSITIESGDFYIGWIETSSGTYFNRTDDNPSFNGRSYLRDTDGNWYNFVDWFLPDNMMIRQGCQNPM
jgi:hypothetical protein